MTEYVDNLTDDQVSLWHDSLLGELKQTLLCPCSREIRKIDWLNPDLDGWTIGDKPGTKRALSIVIDGDRLTIRCHHRCGREHRLTNSRLQAASQKASEMNAACLVLRGDHIEVVNMDPVELQALLKKAEAARLKRLGLKRERAVAR